MAFLDQSLNGSTAGTSEGNDRQYALETVANADAARAQVREGKLSGLLTISRDGAGNLIFDYYADAQSSSRTVLAVQSAVGSLTVSDRLAERGVTDLGQVFAPPDFTLDPVNPDQANQSAEQFGSNYLLSTALVIIMFMAIVMYGSWVAQGVAEEKSSRVMELLITAATPRQLLLGKVLGNGAAGLTQYGSIVVAALVGFVAQGPINSALFHDATSSSDFSGLTLPVLVAFGLFFVTGFILYCTLYAGLGAMVSRQEDVQQIVMPMTMVGMVGYFASFAATAAPSAAWVKVLSFIPFFSPYLIPLRVIDGSMGLVEMAGAFVLMLVFIWLAISIAARIYAAGVLLYGQRPGFRRVFSAAMGRSIRAR